MLFRSKLRHLKKKDFHFDRFLAILRSKQNFCRSKITIIFQLHTPKYRIPVDFRKKRVRPSDSTQKLRHFKKKRFFFRPIFGHFEVKTPKNTKKSTFLTKNFFSYPCKKNSFDILLNGIHWKSFF